MPANMDFVNPIIQSMMFAHQKQQERDRLQQEADQFKETQGIRQHQLKLEETRIKNQEKHETAVLENAAKQLSATLEMNRLQRIGLARDLISRNIDPNKAMASIGGEQIAGLPTSEDAQAQEIAQIQAKAGAQATGQLAATEPFQIRAEGRAEDRATAKGEQDFAHKLKLAGIEHGYRMALEEEQGKRMERIANINGRWHFAGSRAAAMQGNTGLVEQARSLVDNAYLGKGGLTGLPVDTKSAVMRVAQDAGDLKGMPTTAAAEKSYKTSVDTLVKMQEIVDGYRDLARNYSYDSPGSGERGNKYIGLGGLIGRRGFVVPGSELEGKLQNVKGTVGGVVEMFNSDRRQSDADAIRTQGAIFDPKLDAKENLKKVDQLQERLQKIVNTGFAGISPERRAWIFEQLGVRDFQSGDRKLPDFLKVAPQKNKAGHTLDVEESVKLGRPVYAGN